MSATTATAFFLDLFLSLIIILFTFTLFSLPIVSSSSSSSIHTNPYFLNCSIPATCGHQNITFPFYIHDQQPSYCGFPGFALSCINGRPFLNFSSTDNHQDDRDDQFDYVIHNIFYANQSVLVSIPAISDSVSRPCVPLLHDNVSLPLTQVFRPSSNASTTLTLLYNCTLPPLPSNDSLLQHEVECSVRNGETGTVLAVYGDDDAELVNNASSRCSYSVQLQVQSFWKGSRNIEKAVRGGFMMDWKASDCGECNNSGGRCGFNFTSLHFQCYCPDRTHAARCSDDGKDHFLGWKIGLGVGIGSPAIIILVVAFFMVHYKSPHAFSMFRRKRNCNIFRNMDEEWGNVHFEIPIFTNSELEEATNFFDSARELGDGGFGTVYYGKVRDGREVAIKRLHEHNYRRVKQFMTEVQILTRLRHKNLVSLYGCSSQHSRELLLVYEYIPNGTVADHLHGDRSKQGSLPWHIRMSIAIETAKALAYLHASDIVHRDVKTDNILLDNNFGVKVADFGLSRLFPSNVSHVSTAPQGTPGYVDPEYYQCYQLTEKSDVYSFGVVLVELISSMPAVDISRDRNEINLANFATNKMQKRAYSELVDPNLGFGSDHDTSRMVQLATELAFRCLQQEKEMRPTMEDVLEELKAIASGSTSESSEKRKDADRAESIVADPSSSPQCDEAGLLNKANLTPSPVSVIQNCASSGSSSSSK